MEIATNRKAYYDFEILEKFEAGVVLKGLEVKQFRERKVNLSGTYGKILGEEVFWVGSDFTRKLLLNKSEIKRLLGKTVEKGLTVVPLRAYFKRGRVKLEIALARHKKKWDRREEIKKRDLERESRGNK